MAHVGSEDIDAPQLRALPDGEASRGRTGWRKRAHPAEWQWRHRVRQHPRLRGPYRVAVGLLGGSLMLLAALTGWLPGPGGIPLALIGLAVLSTEFEWAARILDWAERKFKTFVAWTSSLHPFWRWLGALATAAGVAVFCWAVLALFGVPDWSPSQVTTVLVELPGVQPAEE